MTFLPTSSGVGLTRKEYIEYRLSVLSKEPDSSMSSFERSGLNDKQIGDASC